MSLSLHTSQPSLPGMPTPTELTVGYVLDASGMQVRSGVAVCHVKKRIEYAIDLPMATRAATATLMSSLPAPTVTSSAPAAAVNRTGSA